MPKLTIDGRETEVPEGATLLEAARALGIEVPTLCFIEGLEPSISCMACAMRAGGKLVPSCATKARDGMLVESETDEVREARRAAVELLLSDHAGDCTGPCQVTCPAHMDIPRMIRLIAAGRLREAVATAKETIALPAALGRVCPAPCEKACRRGRADAPVSICLLKRRAADADLASGDPRLPERAPPTGKRAAVIGAGPAGLAAAYALALAGHDCVVFDDADLPGGGLRRGAGEERLPGSVLDAEIATVTALGVEVRPGTRVGRDVSPVDLVRDFHAVVIAAGELTDSLREGVAGPLSLDCSEHGIAVEKDTFAASAEGVFAAGGVVRKGRMAVRAVAEGRAAALSAHEYLSGRPVRPRPRPFNSRLRKFGEAELGELMKLADPAARIGPALVADAGLTGGFAEEEAAREARRCLHCDCRKPAACKLRRLAQDLGASQPRFAGERRALEVHESHPEVLYEPGKCVACGACVRIAERERERLGLAFIGRGFTVKVGVPFGASVAEGLAKVARECATACPTGAIALRDEAERKG